MAARNPAFVAKPTAFLCSAGCGTTLPNGQAGKCAPCAKGAEYAAPRCPDCGEYGGKNRPTTCTNTFFHVGGIGGVK